MSVCFPVHCIRTLTTVLLGLGVFAAGPVFADEQSGAATAATAEVATLADKLEAYRESGNAQTPPIILAVGQRQREALKNAKIVETALQVGDRAPEFSLPDAHGKMVSSKDLLVIGPVVVTFYRGGWCPYCNLALKALQESLPAFEAEGASMVAISPERPDDELETVKQQGLQFVVLSDHELKIAKAFGIAYQMTAELDSLVRGFGLDIVARNETAEPGLPLGTTYIIDRQGVIRYAFLDVDYSRRAEPADILAVLKKIRKS